MPDPAKSIITLRDLALEPFSQGAFYAGAGATLGPMLGLKGLGLSYSEVPPGKSSCPFHNHHVEDEVFVILSGRGTYRLGAERLDCKAGDVLGAPAGGPDTAHQIINTGDEPLIYLAVSTKAKTEVVEYPDSGKVLTKTSDAEGRPVFRQMVRPTGSLDYWDGEPGS
ncbi:cupin domain-containing protein [Rhizobium sp. CG5]|uniref:cupin domain-containing protein n=1 Tax=Rhizobium sp. CG5 TaxID=2726076 RepID=UPI0020336AEA|nr:cupin domain-containing protein [Rhizobium sp. CG5]MCM2473897.1 cupin domain-containing protein [Rhizobium sp. CG5]